MRVTTICSWSPDKSEEVYSRFEELRKGNAPKDVLEAFSKLRNVAWEKLATNHVIQVIEGDEISVYLWIDYWSDLIEVDVSPSYDLTDEHVVAKITPPAFTRK